MKVPDPTFVAVAVLLGATLDEALASLDDAADAADAKRTGDASGAPDPATSALLLRGLRSNDRRIRARALAAGVEPVMREMAAWDDITNGETG